MKLRNFILCLIVLIVTYSCRRDEEFIEDNSATINFSTDTIAFDTVFTTIGSVTQNFRIYNPHKERIRISSIRLNGGPNSNFRINVDGQAGTYFENIEIASQDSLFVFVEVTVNPDDQQNPFVIEDFIEFNTNGNNQKITLTAWGQNAIYYTPTSFNRNLPDFTCLTGPCSDFIAPVDVTWTDSLPYVIYGYVAIDSLDKLTIEAGTEIYFHNNGGMWVYRGGTLVVNGTKDNPVLFRGDRLEPQYDDIPGQWDRIWINEGGNNDINYAIIENSFIGIQAEALFLNSQPSSLGSLRLRNTTISNCSGFGILSSLFNLTGENVVVSNCGEYNVALQSLGNWRFDHCTFANYSDQGNRETPLFFVQNSYAVGSSIFVDTPRVTVRNSIIYGNKVNEFDFEIINNGSEQGAIEFTFLNDIVRTEKNLSDTNSFKNIIQNPPDEIFNNVGMRDFQLYEFSRARDVGNVTVGNNIPLDINEVSRTSDGSPDLGAYEYEP